MKLNKNRGYTFFSVALIVTLLVSSVSEAQRRRKSEDDSPRGIKLREAEFYFTEGEKYFILEDYSKALIYYQRAMESNPAGATIHYKIAEVLARSNKQDDLIKASISIERARRSTAKASP